MNYSDQVKLDRFTENPKIEGKSQHSKNLKYKFFKNGTLFVSCKGSHHIAWFKEINKGKITGCLDRFCRDCGIVECERSGKSRVKRGKSQK